MNIDFHALMLVSVMSLSLIFLRVVPFLVFRREKTPEFIVYLGKYLPYAIMGMMVVYCLKDTDVLGEYHGIPELIAIAATAAVHIWRRNSLVSIVVGTGVYVILVNYIFI